MRTERNWGLILGTLSAMVVYGVASVAGVSSETAMIRALVGGIVGAFIGYGFNYLGAAVPDRPTKGANLDVVLTEIEDKSHELEGSYADDFQPLDLTKATRVIDRMGEKMNE